MKAPVYNRRETVSQFMRRVHEYDMYLSKKKYNYVLAFLKELFSPLKTVKEFDTLVAFKKIPFEYFSKNNDHCEGILKKHKKWFKKNMDLKFSFKKVDIATYTIHCLVRVLKYIGYKLTKKKGKTQYYYFVKRRK